MLAPHKALTHLNEFGSIRNDEKEKSLLDKEFPPGSTARAFYECNEQNVQRQIKSGKKNGFRFSAGNKYIRNQNINFYSITSYSSHYFA